MLANFKLPLGNLHPYDPQCSCCLQPVFQRRDHRKHEAEGEEAPKEDEDIFYPVFVCRLVLATRHWEVAWTRWRNTLAPGPI